MGGWNLLRFLLLCWLCPPRQQRGVPFLHQSMVIQFWFSVLLLNIVIDDWSAPSKFLVKCSFFLV